MSEENKTPEVQGERRVKLTSMRKTIAKKMLENTHLAALSLSSYEIDATELLKFRQELVEKEEEYEVRISVTDIFCKIIVEALKQSPGLNAFITEDEMIYHDYINLAFAVALPNGLITPVIKGAEKMSLVEIAKESKRLVEKAKNRKITMDDITGGTFSISSMGPNSTGGVAMPLANYPQAGIVQFGAAIKKPVVIDDQIVIREMLRINMTYNHCVVDGADVMKFNQVIKKLIADPRTLLKM